MRQLSERPGFQGQEDQAPARTVDGIPNDNRLPEAVKLWHLQRFFPRGDGSHRHTLHRLLLLEGTKKEAKEIDSKWREVIKKFQRPASSPVEDFSLEPDGLHPHLERLRAGRHAAEESQRLIN